VETREAAPSRRADLMRPSSPIPTDRHSAFEERGRAVKRDSARGARLSQSCPPAQTKQDASATTPSKEMARREASCPPIRREQPRQTDSKEHKAPGRASRPTKRRGKPNFVSAAAARGMRSRRIVSAVL
jgi:hypothetical protein